MGRGPRALARGAPTSHTNPPPQHPQAGIKQFPTNGPQAGLNLWPQTKGLIGAIVVGFDLALGAGFAAYALAAHAKVAVALVAVGAVLYANSKGALQKAKGNLKDKDLKEILKAVPAGQSEEAASLLASIDADVDTILEAISKSDHTRKG